ncbi:MAG: SulP family inorganic anion transporter [Candidatus Mcinerneyibacterium aminivorans]|uniref:SulP family inorganic anion transporter n=1 Tax=Candidatus Mcinerneyibacterium aminivorans TaxID=2703815 RepID=A0A5D0MCV3_9BACT|nr:MAG: SulP family inorganic anion transporter [Candidatus Mcinerneyibacterium aminivorans]
MKFTNLLKSITSYNINYLKYDIKSSFTLATVAVPQNMAYALIAGVNPIYGIYASIVSMISASVLGISNFMILGPTNIIAIAIASNLAFLKNGNYLEGVLFLTFLVGILQIIFSLLKVGKLVNYISHSVIVGLTTGLAVLIGAGQINSILGIKADSGITLVSKIKSIISNLANINYYSLLVGLTTIGLIILLKKLFKNIPSFLTSIILVSLAVYILDMDNLLHVVRIKQSGIPEFHIFNFDFGLMKDMFTAAVSITILSFIQPVSIIKSLEGSKGQKVDFNREFTRLGIINIICSFFKGFVVTGSITNTHVNEQAGAKSRFSQLLTGIIILMLSILFSPIFKYIPIAALSGLVVVVAYNMINIKEIKHIIKTTRFDAIVIIITFLATILAPRLDYAVYIAVGISVILVLRRISSPEMDHINFEDETPEIVEKKSREKREREDYIILNLGGPIYFHAANKLNRMLADSFCKNQKFILRLRNVKNIDYTSIKEIDKFIDKVMDSGGRIIISGVKDRVHDALEKYGIVDKIGEKNIFKKQNKFFSSTQDAIDRAKDLSDENDQ